MQEQEDFNIEQSFVDELLNENISQEENEEKFIEFLKSENVYRKIKSLLSSYHQIGADRGDVHDFSFEDNSFSCNESENNLLGTFTINYEAHYYYGCDDMNSSNEYTMDFSFKITNHIITIIGEKWPVREPDEY